MISTLVVLGVTCSGCGGSSDASKNPTAAPLVQSRADQIEKYKAQSSRPASAARPAPNSRNFKQH